MKYLLLCLVFFSFAFVVTGAELHSNGSKRVTNTPGQPTISFTFDDGNPKDVSDYKLSLIHI